MGVGEASNIRRSMHGLADHSVALDSVLCPTGSAHAVSLPPGTARPSGALGTESCNTQTPFGMVSANVKVAPATMTSSPTSTIRWHTNAWCLDPRWLRWSWISTGPAACPASLWALKSDCERTPMPTGEGLPASIDGTAVSASISSDRDYRHQKYWGSAAQLPITIVGHCVEQPL